MLMSKKEVGCINFRSTMGEEVLKQEWMATDVNCTWWAVRNEVKIHGAEEVRTWGPSTELGTCKDIGTKGNFVTNKKL